MVEDIEKRTEHMVLLGIDDAEFHDATRAPIHDGDKIGDWDQQIAVEILENL
jgi:hypothetical protein